MSFHAIIMILKVKKKEKRKAGKNMKTNVVNLWKYITITAVSLVLLAVFSMFYSATISNQVNRFEDTPICYRTIAEE